MNRLFTSTGYLDTGRVLSSSGNALDLAKLPPFLRVLLTTDGTVTKSIESYFWESVTVSNCGQQYVVLATDMPSLAHSAGEKVMQREVRLVGDRSGTVYASASSLICTELLPANIRRDLENGVVGIGEILRECSLETYREITDIGMTHYDDEVETTVWRTYRIVMEHQPLIQITEHFPLSVYTAKSECMVELGANNQSL